MNTDFRIIKENTFSLKGGKLYTMLLRENGVFGVEVVDRTKTFGRKFAKTFEDAEFLFDSIAERIAQYKDLTDAENAIARCFAFKSLDKLLFVLIMDDRLSSQADIVAIKGKFKFRTRLKFGYRKKVKDIDSLTIYIYDTETSKRPYAVMYGAADAQKLIFELL